MENSQMKKMQSIQNSLLALKARIDKMMRIGLKQEQTMNQLILSTVPVVEKKLKEVCVVDEMHAKESQKKDNSQSLKKRNQQSRLVNERQVSRSKQLLSIVKHHNSQHLKKSTQLNEEAIYKKKQDMLLFKRQRKNIVKLRQEQAQLKIRQFHQHKQQSLKLRKQQQFKENERKIDQMLKQLTVLVNQQSLYEQKTKQTNEQIKQFKDMIHRIDKMKYDNFNQLKSEILGKENSDDATKISRALLNYAIKKQL